MLLDIISVSVNKNYQSCELLHQEVEGGQQVLDETLLVSTVPPE